MILFPRESQIHIQIEKQRIKNGIFNATKKLGTKEFIYSKNKRFIKKLLEEEREKAREYILYSFYVTFSFLQDILEEDDFINDFEDRKADGYGAFSFGTDFC